MKDGTNPQDEPEKTNGETRDNEDGNHKEPTPKKPEKTKKQPTKVNQKKTIENLIRKIKKLEHEDEEERKLIIDLTNKIDITTRRWQKETTERE